MATINGTPFDDYILGTIFDDTIDGLEGNDSLFGFGGRDFLYGGTGNDFLDGGLGNDVLAGQDGNDILSGGNGDNGQDLLDGGSGNDRLDGGDGNDFLNGRDGIDTAEYRSAAAGVTVDLNRQGSGFAQNTVGAGSDTLVGIENLTGSNFSDSLTGNGGDNVLEGLAGNDTLNGGGGNDRLDGGAGIDTASYRTATAGVTVHLWFADAQNTGGAGIDTLVGIENLTGSIFSDRLVGNAANNVLSGVGGGEDQLFGLEGNDTLNGGSGNDYLNGGSEADTMNGGFGNDLYMVNDSGDVVIDPDQVFPFFISGGIDTVESSITYTLPRATQFNNIENLQLWGVAAINGTGNGNNNTIFGNSANNVLSGLAGNDTLEGLMGNDTLNGGDGNDILAGWDGIDTASYATATAGVTVNLSLGYVWQDTLGAGSDALQSIENLTGSTFNDTLTGDGGNNVLSGLRSNDNLNGGAGNDTLLGGGGLDADLLNGGLGTDTASYSDATAGVTVNLGLAGAQNTVGAGLDTLVSMENLTGSNFNDILTGNVSINTLDGGLGTDTLRGGGGNDTLIGGAGRDILTGGVGNDIFDYNAAGDSLPGAVNRDVITDFNGLGALIGDQIDLRDIDANTVLSGNQAFSWRGATPGGAGTLWYTGGVLYGNVDGDVAAEFQIQLVGAPALVVGGLGSDILL